MKYDGDYTSLKSSFHILFKPELTKGAINHQTGRTIVYRSDVPHFLLNHSNTVPTSRPQFFFFQLPQERKIQLILTKGDGTRFAHFSWRVRGLQIRRLLTLMGFHTPLLHARQRHRCAHLRAPLPQTHPFPGLSSDSHPRTHFILYATYSPHASTVPTRASGGEDPADC